MAELVTTALCFVFWLGLLVVLKKLVLAEYHIQFRGLAVPRDPPRTPPDWGTNARRYDPERPMKRRLDVLSAPEKATHE